MKKAVTISPCGLYRYELWRDTSGFECEGLMAFVMLNPSTADASKDDPTIRRCMDFARRHHCDRMAVVNLFAYRATDPTALVRAADPVGPENDAHLRGVLSQADVVVAAWGAHKMVAHAGARVALVRSLARDRLRCLGTTSAGHPRHPLYLPATAPLTRWPADGGGS